MLSSLHIIYSAPPWLILRDSVVCEYLPPPPTCAVSGGSVFCGGGGLFPHNLLLESDAVVGGDTHDVDACGKA